MQTSLTLPVSLDEISTWVTKRHQSAICGSETRCLIAQFLREHNPDFNGVIEVTDDDDGWEVRLNHKHSILLPHWLGTVASAFDQLVEDPENFSIPCDEDSGWPIDPEDAAMIPRMVAVLVMLDRVREMLAL